ncbi:hypothetical protein J437_LFUL014722 [Ladona fulva]|uniref:Uncharacterized protein n=1 Tax=Ladona fulva TaxID=123851 RepID=A0A8K0KCK3_LADFU|nr:hypothetical protein J437_LFUL014722 [Ladona fulva]
MFWIDFRYLAAPNLAKSEVLKMLEAEEQTRQGPGERRGVLGRWGPSGAGPPRPPSTTRAPSPGRRLMPGKIEWPPKASHIVQAPKFFTSNQGLKRVAWPPPPENKVNDVVEEAPATYQAPLYNGTTQKPWENGYSNNQHREVNPPKHHQPVRQQVYKPVASPPPPPPSTVVLRTEPPISQEQAPVYFSQPAVKRQDPIKMRGDQKWPPEHYKQAKEAEMIAAEQAKARARAAGKPRRVNRDYTAFFAQNALNPTYPGYKAPPGTQHYEEEGTSNL